MGGVWELGAAKLVCCGGYGVRLVCGGASDAGGCQSGRRQGGQGGRVERRHGTTSSRDGSAYPSSRGPHFVGAAWRAGIPRCSPAASRRFVGGERGRHTRIGKTLGWWQAKPRGRGKLRWRGWGPAGGAGAARRVRCSAGSGAGCSHSRVAPPLPGRVGVHACVHAHRHACIHCIAPYTHMSALRRC